MRVKHILFLLLPAVVFGIWSFTKAETKRDLDSNQSSKEVKDSTSSKIEKHEIEWISIEEAMKRHAEEPRYWIMDLYTDWCGWCKRMDATTFKDSIITAEIKENFYAVKFNAEAKRDITVDGKTYKFVPNGRRGYHELAAQILDGKLSYPSFAYFNNKGQKMQVIPGFKTREQLHPILDYIGNGIYQNTRWEDYMKSYKSPYPAPEPVEKKPTPKQP